MCIVNIPKSQGSTMARKHLRLHNDHQKELVTLLRGVARRHGLWRVWCDFIAMCALAISNSVDRARFDSREAEYLTIANRYESEERTEIARGLSLVVLGLETDRRDFLGSLFMALDLGDAHRGQFFTPYEVCVLLARMSLGGDLNARVAQNGFVSVLEPCVGAGAMLIAATKVFDEEGLNYQQQMHATAIDLDITAVHMAYVQLSLLHVPAIVIHGNGLTVDVARDARGPNAWRTPAHVLGFWDSRLARRGAREQRLDTPRAGTESTRNPSPVLELPHTESRPGQLSLL